MDSGMVVPLDWRSIEINRLTGTVLIIGATDAGKSTLARYLYQKLAEQERVVGLLDGDPGQSELGPPTTINLGLNKPGSSDYPPQGRRWCRCIGSTSPSGHMLPLVSGAVQLVEVARGAGAETILYDTTGLIDPAAGGHYLKWSKIDLLKPQLVVAIQRERELEGLLVPLRRSQRAGIIELEPAPAASRRNSEERKEHRRRQYRQYFKPAAKREIDWGGRAVFPRPDFHQDQLVALEDDEGFCAALGLILETNYESSRLTIRTPLRSFESVDTLHLASIALDPNTYHDRMLHS